MMDSSPWYCVDVCVCECECEWMRKDQSVCIAKMKICNAHWIQANWIFSNKLMLNRKFQSEREREEMVVIMMHSSIKLSFHIRSVKLLKKLSIQSISRRSPSTHTCTITRTHHWCDGNMMTWWKRPTKSSC